MSALSAGRILSFYLTNWSNAALLRQYPNMPGKGLMPATLETWIMFPWLVVRWGELALVRMKADLGNNYEG